jgi:hypothetical protein
MGNVTESLAGIKAALGLVHEIGIAAQASHRGFKSEPGPQGWFFKEHDNLLARERFAKIGWPRLHHASKIEHGFDAARAEIAR